MTLRWSYGGNSIGHMGLQGKFDGVRLFYRSRTNDGEWYDIDEIIPTVWSPTQFGGRRQWFCCLKCGRTCRILYGGSRFRCRRCYRLSYSSQAETHADRATRAMFKIVKRLDPEEDCMTCRSSPKACTGRPTIAS